ncbi:A/G-specific adenine glycosylase [Symbiobacterium terraclitae]|uniref:A/G-specific adenine glycosylase n=1 Tax=Symbiobacterium terraclitae TaxID=557451 RepID=UPI0035B519D5
MRNPGQDEQQERRRAAEIAGRLLEWYGRHGRDLPWRRTRDPYHIWVSEVMLQQTRVETVIPYYERWMAQFPTLEALAGAPEEQVLKAWEGLGYYSRARNLHQAAREVVSRYGGSVPDDPEAVSRLKGVGPYTAGAILSIAFNRPVPAVDGNVLRVIARLYAIADDIALPATRKVITELVRAMMPAGRSADFNQALMDLGATICTPRSPRCLLCPVREACEGFRAGRVGGLPVKGKARAPRPVERVAAVVEQDGRLLLTRRPPDGLLAGLWELPGGDVPPGRSPEDALRAVLWDAFRVEAVVGEHLVDVTHAFTHLVWHIRCYRAELGPGCEIPETPDRRWVAPEELKDYPLPTVQRKVLAALHEARTPGVGLNGRDIRSAETGGVMRER